MASKKKDTLLSTAAAANKLGITVNQFNGLAKKLGIEPDDHYVNPHYRSGPPAKLWAPKTLASLQRRTAFKEFLQGAAKRSASADEAVRSKVSKLKAECEAWVPEVKVLPLEDAVFRAINSYNDFGMTLRHSRPWASRESAPEFLFRITQNHIRHCLTDYEYRLEEIRGRVGTSEAYELILRPIVDEAIDEAYPELAFHLASTTRQKFLEAPAVGVQP